MDQYERFSAEARHRSKVLKIYKGTLENYLRFLRGECFMSIDQIEKFLLKTYEVSISHNRLSYYLGEK